MILDHIPSTNRSCSFSDIFRHTQRKPYPHLCVDLTDFTFELFSASDTMTDMSDIQIWTTLPVDRQAPPPAPNSGAGKMTLHREIQDDGSYKGRCTAPNLNNQNIRVRPPGVPSSILIGKASQGGFGVFPWFQHIMARHAVWASRALQWMTTDPYHPPKRRGITMTQPL